MQKFQMREYNNKPIFYDTEQYIYEKNNIPDANFHDYIPMDNQQVCQALNIFHKEIEQNHRKIDLLIQQYQKVINAAIHIGVYDNIIKEMENDDNE